MFAIRLCWVKQFGWRPSCGAGSSRCAAFLGLATSVYRPTLNEVGDEAFEGRMANLGRDEIQHHDNRRRDRDHRGHFVGVRPGVWMVDGLDSWGAGQTQPLSCLSID